MAGPGLKVCLEWRVSARDLGVLWDEQCAAQQTLSKGPAGETELWAVPVLM